MHVSTSFTDLAVFPSQKWAAPALETGTWEHRPILLLQQMNNVMSLLYLFSSFHPNPRVVLDPAISPHSQAASTELHHPWIRMINSSLYYSIYFITYSDHIVMIRWNSGNIKHLQFVKSLWTAHSPISHPRLITHRVRLSQECVHWQLWQFRR